MVNSINLEENMSLGKMLNKARLDRNLSVHELSSITKIHKTLIHSLENDEIENLPNRIYVLGFLKSICDVLHFDLEKSIYLYELSLLKMMESNIPREVTLEEAPEKVVPINLFTQRKFIKAKWLLVCAIFSVFMLIISPLLIQNDKTEASAESPVEKMTIHKSTKKKSSKDSLATKLIVRPSSFNVSLNATKGISWISFQVDKNPTRKMTLKKGSSIILKGESIRLVLGNYKALIIKNNKELITIKKNIIGDVAKINFPQEKNDFTPAQKLIFTLENKVNDQTQRL